MNNRDFMNRLNQGRRTLAALYEGSFSSFFADSAFNMLDDFIAETHMGKIIALPNMNFISSQGAAQNESNMNFLMNAIDYSIDNPALIALRSRDVLHKPLNIDKLINTTDIKDEEKEKRRANLQRFIRYTNNLLPVLLIILYGLIRYQTEINRRKRIREIYE